MDRLNILAGNITHSKVDAIVSPADTTLLGGDDIILSIHQAAGRELQQACQKLQGCPLGEARITKGYALPASWVIHTASPVWKGGNDSEHTALSSCYRSCLELAESYGLKTLDFSPISIGSGGYPIYEAATIALRAIMEHLRTHALPEQIRIICPTEEIARVYSQMWNFWFARTKADRMPTDE